MRTSEDDPDHPILPAPWTWELTEFTYRIDPTVSRTSYIDLVFAKDGIERRLRFFEPCELVLTRGLPNSSGLYIKDVSRRQLEGIGVKVDSFEGDWCVPSFWAESVVEIAEPEHNEPVL